MRAKSHISLGHYLLDRYRPDLTRLHRKAFLLGCIQPDRNPFTYLKGSLKAQWFRGHNYINAQQFIHRIACRLEQKAALNTFDYYTLGKLIHYTADAFTYAHNEGFCTTLSDHRKYEIHLQKYFLDYLKSDPTITIRPFPSVTDGIRIHHQEYGLKQADIYWDSQFALQTCCGVFALLFAPHII